jgi:hypothetical protein
MTIKSSGLRSAPELLAPAGNWECARAAVENGADAIYFVQTGEVQLTVVSPQGKEAVLAMMGPRDFLGEEALELETLAAKRRRAQGQARTPLGLGDFFFDPDDPLHPDRPTGQDDDED